MIRLFRKPRAVPEPHKHVFDSEVGFAKFGGLTALECRCGVGRLFSDRGIDLQALRVRREA